MIQKIFQGFGTVNTISVYDNRKNSKEAIDRAETLVKDMDSRWSIFREDSELSEINRRAGGEYISVHEDTYELLKRSVECSELTDGLFDITMQPLIELFYSAEKGEIASDDIVNNRRGLVNYRHILLKSDGYKVKLKRAGQKISLGAIAKGYAADKISTLLYREGIEDFIVNFGGTVAVRGSEKTVGLQHPLKETGQIFGTLTVEDKILVTSGAYERSYFKNGMFYHHILDPRTGKSSKSDLLSITLVGDDGALLDALATAIFVCGLERMYQLIQELGLQGVFVTTDLKIYATEGLKQSLNIISLEKTS